MSQSRVLTRLAGQLGELGGRSSLRAQLVVYQQAMIKPENNVWVSSQKTKKMPVLCWVVSPARWITECLLRAAIDTTGRLERPTTDQQPMHGLR
jgi:hypothetical protein